MGDWLDIAIKGATLIGMFLTIAVQVRTLFYVKQIEKQGNSMQTALVAATERAAGAEGEARGRAQEKT
jgi:hypothetical protein